MNRLIAWSCIIFVALPLAAQQPAEIERVAALRFALANGLQLPAGVTVATQTFADSGKPRPRATRQEFRDRDAAALVAEIGASARTGSAFSLVTCRRLVCWVPAGERVLIVTDPESLPERRTVVGLTFYSRDSAGNESTTGASVLVEQRVGGWVGVGYSIHPFTVRPRIPPG